MLYSLSTCVFEWDVVETLPWTAGEEDVQSSVRSRVNTQMSMSDKSTERYLCLVPAITEGHQSCGSHQVSSCTELGGKVKSNAHNYPSRGICKSQTLWELMASTVIFVSQGLREFIRFHLMPSNPNTDSLGFPLERDLCGCIYQASDGVNTHSSPEWISASVQAKARSCSPLSVKFPFHSEDSHLWGVFSSQVVCLTSAVALCERLFAGMRPEKRPREKKLLTQWLDTIIYLHTTQVSRSLFCSSPVVLMANSKRTELNTGHGSEEWGRSQYRHTLSF